jgi:hypothetical protein
MALYQIYNGPCPTTAAQVAVTTGNTIKTMLQVSLGYQADYRSWSGASAFDGSSRRYPD